MMKILFFSNIPIKKVRKDGYNGGGWISSFIERILTLPNVDCAIASFDNRDEVCDCQKLKIYHIKDPVRSSVFLKIKKRIDLFSNFYLKGEMSSWSKYEKSLLKVVDDYKPDIIHIWGSEQQFGLIANLVRIPVVLHIQGIMNPYLNAYLPPFFSWNFKITSPISSLKVLKEKRLWIQQCLRERFILSKIKNYIGRTVWDERVTKIFNPQSKYFYGGEILREEFYEEIERNIPKKLTIVSTISNPLYKGYDCILKTAYILKKYMRLEFLWNVYGNINPNFVEKIVNIKHQNVDVYLQGVASSNDLKKAILNATVYVHPSYIDNSPNSVCEAQMLGVPVIASNVGGLSSIIDDGKTGFLVPANDPYQMAYLILSLYQNKEFNKCIGKEARLQALKRHDRDNIVNGALDIYQNIIQIFYLKQK